MCALSCGIVGLPNIGKSTLFNVLTKTQMAEAANYPFCTIEPNKAVISVQDERLKIAAQMAKSAKTIFPQVEVVDIAGLVKGASSGAGLGNKFLENIREVDVIIHVLRFFVDKDVIGEDLEGGPQEARQIIENELILADLGFLESLAKGLEKKAKSNSDAKAELLLVSQLTKHLEAGKLASDFSCSDEAQAPIIRSFRLLTSKPVLYLCNVSDDDYLEKTFDENSDFKALEASVGVKNLVVLPIKLESAFIDMTQDERVEYLTELGAPLDGIERLIKRCYAALDMECFFTVGPQEARSWSIKKGSRAQAAAGKIHSDIEKNFIRANVMSYEDFTKYGGEVGCREAGKLRVEGKDYIVRDADIMHFLHSG